MGQFSSEDDVGFLQRKIPFLFLAVFLFILIIVGRLYYLQIILGQSFRHRSESLSVRLEELRAPRGRVLDRDGKVLADERPYFELTVIPQYLSNKEKTIDSLVSLVPLKKEEIKDTLYKNRFLAPFHPVVIQTDMPYEWVAKIKEYSDPEYQPQSEYYLDGVELIKSHLRVYLYPELFSHALGYLTEINKDKLEKLKEKYPERYSLGDLVGANGLEGAYDLDLRGHDGVLARVVDARGREVQGDEDLDLLQIRASQQSTPGYDLETTLDYDTQKAAAEAMGNQLGGVVAIDPFSGEILVLYSSPGYDANRIIKNIDKAYWQKINLHEDRFLYNRTVQAAYPPGSIYKMVPAFAGLDMKVITPETSFRCSGGLRFGRRYFKCWNKGGHGVVNLNRGLGQSCDVYFYQVGLRVGVDGLNKYAHLFGFGEKTGIEIAYENPGLIPSSEWKQRRFKQKWIESETLSISIGQGYDLVTPVQAAKMIAMVANGGKPLTPHLGKRILDKTGQLIREIQLPLGEPVVPEDIVKRLQAGVIEVVHGAGTAKRMQQSPYKIAGKTGTAQVVGHDSNVKHSHKTKPHGWFVGYAPYDDPKIAVAAIVENGGSGGAAAGPVVLKVINTYLDKLLPHYKDQQQ